MVVLLMGVSGAGKTAVGRALATRLGWSFLDGDDLHSAENIRKMSVGRSLTDQDRGPWLAAIRASILELEARSENGIIACSALKEDYRRRILAGTGETRIVYLRGTPELIAERLRNRWGHYFDVGLLASQFAALEEPSGCDVVDVDAELVAVIDAVAQALQVG